MLNREKYKDEILDIALMHQTAGFSLNTGKLMACGSGNCFECKFSHMNNNDALSYNCGRRFKKWLDEEYKEPQVDWSKVPVDTKVLVKDQLGYWGKRYFAKYEDGRVFTFREGATSWSNHGSLVWWDEAKLAEDEVE